MLPSPHPSLYADMLTCWHAGMRSVPIPIQRHRIPDRPPYKAGASALTGYTANLPPLYNIMDLMNGTEPARHNQYNGTYSAEMYSKEAVNIIEQYSSAASPPPFYMYVALQSIHTPLEVPQAYHDLYPSLPARSEQRLILAMVTALDDTVGNITAALKANPAVWDNTLLIFHSDNGGDSHGNNFPLRAGKFTLWPV